MKKSTRDIGYPLPDLEFKNPHEVNPFITFFEDEIQDAYIQDFQSLIVSDDLMALSKPQIENYFGPSARTKFRSQYQDQCNSYFRDTATPLPRNIGLDCYSVIENNVNSNHNLSQQIPQIITDFEVVAAPTKTPCPPQLPKSRESYSARTGYIRNCIAEALSPRASLILRKTISPKLQLQHFNMGDELAIQLAQSIPNMPYLEAINIKDNSLSDNGLMAIFHSLHGLHSITELDVSNNVFGELGSQALGNYLGSNQCSLKTLILQKADVDDFEGEAIISRLRMNSTSHICELDLSHNTLGSGELRNTVRPDLVTCGEAIASWLQMSSCSLKSLKLAWNMIRLGTAVELCQSLAYNQSLTHVDLSYNALGSEGGKALGGALTSNHTLKSLLVNNNNIDACASFTLIVSAQESSSLEILNMDENPIGEIGARAIMTCSFTSMV